MANRVAIEGALQAWRDAERRFEAAGDGEREPLEREVLRCRAEFQQISSDHMVWESAHSNDVDTPQTEANQRGAAPARAPGPH